MEIEITNPVPEGVKISPLVEENNIWSFEKAARDLCSRTTERGIKLVLGELNSVLLLKLKKLNVTITEQNNIDRIERLAVTEDYYLNN